MHRLDGAPAGGEFEIKEGCEAPAPGVSGGVA